MEEKIYSILTDLGYNLQDKGKFWHTNAVYRNGDNRTSVQIWKNSGVWKDYVINGQTFFPFKKLLELSCEDPDKIDAFLSECSAGAEHNFKQKSTPKMELDQFFDHDEVKNLMPHFSFYEKKGISSDILKLYKSGFSMSGKMNGRYVFPIFDENKKVIGVTGRHLLWKAESTFPKWKHLGKKANWLYPFYLDQSFSQKVEDTQEIIIIEGIGDSLALSQQGYKNHLVAFGLDLSSKQLSFLTSLSLKKIIIATNNDDNKDINRGYLAAVKLFLKLITYFDISKIEINLPIRKDFGEMLEMGDCIDQWKCANIDKRNQLLEILSTLDQDVENPTIAKKKKLIKNYLYQYDAEKSSIS